MSFSLSLYFFSPDVFLRKAVFWTLLLLLLSPTKGLATAQDTTATKDNIEVESYDIILLEINRLRGEINQLSESEIAHLDDRLDIINDRLAALDRRLLTIEGRVNLVFGELGKFELYVAAAVGVMLAIAVITLFSLLLFRKRSIDPVHIQLASLKALIMSTNGENGDDSSRLKLALRDLAKDDPYLKQILKRHKLL